MNSIWLQGHPIRIIVGHYGSGKTEIALCAALDARKAGARSCVVDLDIVNPFFRSAEQAELLRRADVDLIAPEFALTAADIPILGANILSVFEKKDTRTFFDVGGDDAGASALGRFHPQFEKSGYEMMAVINPLRPRTRTVAEAKDMIERIAYRSRLEVTHLIDNTNLGDETTPEILKEGAQMVDEVSRETGIPVFCRTRLCPQAEDEFGITRHLKPEWL